MVAPPRDVLREAELLVRSRYAVLLCDTEEEDRAETLLRYLAAALGIPFFTWTRTKGLGRDGSENAAYGTADPSGALGHVEASGLSAIYFFRGLRRDLEDKTVAEKLADAARRLSQKLGAIVLVGRGIELPDSVKPMAAVVKLPPPTVEDYRDLLRRILEDLSRKTGARAELSPEDLSRLLYNLKGLTLLEAEKILTKAIIEDGRLTADDIRKVIQAKKSIVEREGVLEYFPAEEKMADVADLAGLKTWLAERRAILADPKRAAEFGLTFPKGILLLGVPGCGKSLCAKAVASEWGLPLLKLDPSTLYNKYLGESEKNLRRAIATAEKVAPVVLWIDEIEKAFSYSGGAEDGGVSMRVFGTFLSWLQDRTAEVFVVATANDVTRLPPEFLRKGRFDEIFFVDLPDAEVRKALFAIHLRKRGQDPARFDLPRLSGATEGFSGSEVEQAVVSALYAAFAAGTALSTEALLEEVSRTRPLSRTMAEKIAWLREWARGRTRSAH
ncbi:MAG TPA: AAA family ATPase [Planctomycetota bacterium]|nr:AAA family ATPase [Planctomycetota bacterium]